MLKWEYCYLTHSYIFYFRMNESVSIARFEEAITQLGLEGWEMVTAYVDISQTYFYFKRSLPQKEAP